MPDTTVHMVLAAVEQLAPASCGAFLVELDSSKVGSVFVERNQVCWAAYTGLSRRLRDLLRENLATAIDEGELDRTYAQCTREGRRFGEELVARDMIKAEAMRRALKQHTIESLIAFPQEQGEVLDWVEHRRQGYQPRFTFRPAELLVGVNALLYATEATGAELSLSSIAPDARGATFVPADGGGLVAIRMHGEGTTIADLDALGGWAEAAFGVTRGFSRDVMRRTMAAATGALRIAWQTSRLHTHAAVLERGERLDRLVAQLEDIHVPTVITRAP